MANRSNNIDLITMNIFPQDPESTPEPVPVKVRGGILPGPVGSRIAVFDYNRDRDEVYTGARPREDGTFPEYDPNDLRFHQLNTYAIVARAIELVEMELGRNLQWGFDASRLIILPHAGYLANAYYSKETNSLQFYSFTMVNSDDIFHTALSHDIVAHETGHAILDSVRGRYTDAWEVETAAIHEALGDLTTIFAGLSHNVVLVEAANDLTQVNFISQIAENFFGKNHPLRNLYGQPQSLSYWKDQFTPHDRSLQLTRAIYDALVAIHQKCIAIKGDRISALRLARRALQRMVVRGLDYLPPVDATFADFGIAMLKADQFANPEDKLKFRETVTSKLQDHIILSEIDIRKAYQQDSKRWLYYPHSWPFLTISDAYLFLDNNRNQLALSKFGNYRDFVVRSVHCAKAPEQRIQDGGKALGTSEKTDKVVIVYEYPVDVELKDHIFGSFEGQWITVWGGGTLVFNADGNLQHHAQKVVERERVDHILCFLKTGCTRGYIQPTMDSLDDEVRQASNGRIWLLRRISDRAALTTNSAVRCKLAALERS